ncbi:hypothetical protein, partial [Candidatus Propionivibrio aalborgensis]|uniref:hypothetical protein n=1 Tax=Candidatus Propionivibrio aalborgensis TaxID=1860101 RepID=UPI001C9191A2
QWLGVVSGRKSIADPRTRVKREELTMRKTHDSLLSLFESRAHLGKAVSSVHHACGTVGSILAAGCEFWIAQTTVGNAFHGVTFGERSEPAADPP